jgi:hypothetical protein
MNRETASRVTSHGFLADIDCKADDGEDVSVASLTSKPPLPSDGTDRGAALNPIQFRPVNRRDLRAE